MINDNNVTYAFVGNVTSGYTNTSEVDIDAMPAGSAVMVQLDTNNATTGNPLAAFESFSTNSTVLYQIINKLSDGTIVRSPMFKGADVISIGTGAYAQPSQQVSFLGYDGTTINGLGTITLGDSYTVSISLAYTAGEYSQQPEIKTISAYATDTLQATVVKNLFESHLLNFGPIRQKNPSILCDRVARTTSVADLGGSGDVVYLTNGSKTVSAWVKDTAADVAFTADDFAVTAGDVISIPSYNGRTFTFTCLDAVGHTIHIGTAGVYIADQATAADGSDNATALAAAINLSTNAISAFASATAAGAVVTVIYKEDFRGLPPVVFSNVAADPTTVAVTIASGDAVSVKYTAAATAAAATFTLDEPWQGPTGYVYAGTTEATHIGIATLNAANAWGLKFTGLMQPFNPVVDRFTMVQFDVLGGAFGAFGTEYKAVKANEGHGNWRTVATLEQYAQGNATFYRTSNYPYTINRTEAVAGTGGSGYDIWNAVVKPSVTFAASGINVASPITLVVAIRSILGDYDEFDDCTA